MKVLVDIGHPAHIHYFKNCAKILCERGHDFLFIVRERDSTLELIESTGLNYISRGKGKKGVTNKILGIPSIDFKIFKIAKAFKPDLCLSFGSPYLAQVSKIIEKPHIAFDDTEHARFSHALYRPFTETILSPSCYLNPPVKKQLFFDSYMEISYLHPNYFVPNKTVLDSLGLRENEKYCVLRLISWDANHDVGQLGLTYHDKIALVNALSKGCRVFISSEEELDDSLKKYQLNIHPKDLHSILSYASLYLGEGGTTASEAVVLGTPSIYINSLNAGVFKDEEERGLLFHLSKFDDIIKTSHMILNNEEYQQRFKNNWKKLLDDKIDLTAFMVWFIDNYPESKKIMEETPDYQYKFKN